MSVVCFIVCGFFQRSLLYILLFLLYWWSLCYVKS